MRVTKCKYVKRFFTELITVIMILIFLKVYYLTYLDIHLFNNKSRANQMFIKHGWNIFRIKKTSSAVRACYVQKCCLQ